MGLQILQYEFLGPIPLSEWGPPMGDLVYLVLSRSKDRFNMLYVDDCAHTDDKAFFVQHKQFKCWTEKAGSDSALYLAVFPMKDSKSEQRRLIMRRILSVYHPLCNPVSDLAEKKPTYDVRKVDDSVNTDVNDDNADTGADSDGYNITPASRANFSDHANDTDNKDGSTVADTNNIDTTDGDYSDNPVKTNTSSMSVGDTYVNSVQQNIACPCCGYDMKIEKTIGKNSMLYRCGSCNMSETRVF